MVCAVCEEDYKMSSTGCSLCEDFGSGFGGTGSYLALWLLALILIVILWQCYSKSMQRCRQHVSTGLDVERARLQELQGQPGSDAVNWVSVEEQLDGDQLDLDAKRTLVEESRQAIEKKARDMRIAAEMDATWMRVCEQDTAKIFHLIREDIDALNATVMKRMMTVLQHLQAPEDLQLLIADLDAPVSIEQFQQRLVPDGSLNTRQHLQTLRQAGEMLCNSDLHRAVFKAEAHLKLHSCLKNSTAVSEAQARLDSAAAKVWNRDSKTFAVFNTAQTLQLNEQLMDEVEGEGNDEEMNAEDDTAMADIRDAVESADSAQSTLKNLETLLGTLQELMKIIVANLQILVVFVDRHPFFAL